jgi:thiamine biosynthesis lipoprotein
MLDCSAIAKGFGSDMVAQMLSSKGINDYMVEIGGEIVLSGHNPKGKDWNIGISKPVDDSLSMNNELQTVIPITDIAMATSGNYRNFYVKDGRKYAHTIDPHTCMPVSHSLLSATVFAADCATADALATSMMVMGLDSAQALIARHPEINAYFIYQGEEGTLSTTSTPGLER